MKKNNVIQLHTHAAREGFDYAACNRRAEVRFRSSEIRAWLQWAVENTVTLAIGVCTVISVCLALSML